MKNIFIFFCFMIFSIPIVSQNFLSTIDVENKWYKIQSFQTKASESRLEYYSEDSIIINGEIYRELLSSSQVDGSEPSSKGFYREEEGKLYQHDNNQDFLIFDMNLTLEDEFLINGDTLVIIDVDSLNYSDGQVRKRIKLSCNPDDLNNPDNRVLTLIEGVGYVEEYIDDCSQLIGTSLSLNCFEKEGEVVFSNSNYDFCWLITETLDVEIFNIQLFPNPSSRLINIKAKHTPDKIEVMSADGSIVLKKENTLQFEISNLPSGFYYIRVFYDGKISTKSFVRN